MTTSDRTFSSRAPLRNARRRALSSGSLIALLVLPAALSAGPPTGIRGRLQGTEKMRPEVFEEAQKPSSRRYNWRQPSPTVPKAARELWANPSRDIVVAAFGTADSKALGPIQVRIAGGRSVPSVLVVSPGTALSFKNVDPFAHRLFQQGETKWPANRLEKGQSREWTAVTPGRYEIRDEFFPSLRTYIIVEPKVVAYAYPTRLGQFTMDVPTGDYTLRTFFAGKPVSKEVPGIKVTDKQGVFEIREPILLGEAK